MKANELMSGDLIYVYGRNKNMFSDPHWYVRRVTADWLVDMTIRETNDKKLFDNGIVIPEQQLFIGDTKPIPLTEDILKANADGGSCSFDEFRSLYHFKTNGYHREISISFDKTWSVPFVEITGMGQTTIKVNMQYVHELQRALRCCGLFDLADNFKIE